jgi:hypothetical protein|tara:strand:- start:612 stop:830 length:219 start_codon:yes stop_codon:yes gene_type:complete
MFKLDDKEYDETKLNDKGKFSFAQLQTLAQKKNAVLADLNNLDILVSHYSSILQEEVKELSTEVKEEVKKES